ncbi:hypothetical protein JCM19241_3072 [Vibrio ishigakensis]|uniref:Uncharacterized protein n=1 Tax=Vibrio ishigakensis TaxID=1481914 RepID=A0A0B8Q9K6_9VIBR|nr:hypothetical protein JCM19241_3072 [Vibrio ishigakensis]
MFVLFCSEWFRREYQNEWSWNPIFEKLGFQLDASEISKVTKLGIESYWGRSIFRTKVMLTVI